ncbi:MAG: ATP synthase subunit I [Proteobacteria bacterium]|nr:ATP synthase subunit I [Pseudomonadota bacterium]
MTGKFLHYILSFILGVGLGTVYYTALWWTVRALPAAGNPALLSLGSFFVRMIVVLSGFYLVLDSSWERLLFCLIGFFLARSVLIRRLGPERRVQNSARKGV